MARSATPTACPIKEVLASLPAEDRAELQAILDDGISSTAIASWAIARGHKKAGVSAVSAHRQAKCECFQ